MTIKANTGGGSPSPNETGNLPSKNRMSPVIWTALFLALVLSVLFHKSFTPNWVHFSNDGPYGAIVAQESLMPDDLTGTWVDLNWLGGEYLPASPSFTSLLRCVLSPLSYGQLLPPVTLLFVGLCASFCFRKLGLSPLACILGGIAAALNSDFFSTSCWGVASQIVGFGGMYLAIGLGSEPERSLRSWLLVVVAGLGVGLGIMEAYDIGAIFSLFVAAFIMFHSVFIAKGSLGGRIGTGVAKVSMVAVIAALVSAYTLAGLVGTQVAGVAAAQQDKDTKERSWPFATQWSLPKKEVLQVIIPGIFGYRNQWHMYDSGQPHADQYWGTIGIDPNIEVAKSQLHNPDPEVRSQAENYLKSGLLWRLVGTGFYAGVPVVMLALWGVFQSFRGKDSPFTEGQRRVIKFWLGALVLSLLLSFGRYAPFYKFFYSLPYASTIRNPDKFMHVLSYALIILFAFGVQALYLTCMQKETSQAASLGAQFKAWRSRAGLFQTRWLNACLVVLGISVLAWFVYGGEIKNLEDYLRTVSIPEEDVHSVARFSINAVGWFVLLLALTTALITLIFIGRFSGRKARLGGILLGALIILDLSRADIPWIFYADIDYKYATDPIIKLLADKSYEHRVSMLPIQASTQQLALLQNAYGSHWKQHLFVANNIQCTDIIQEPRVSQDKDKLQRGLPMNTLENVLRFWELSNTRYILGPGAGLHALETLDPEGKKFRILQSFDFVPKIAEPKTAIDFKAVPNPDGQLAVIEFLGALPRAVLYSNWQVNTNDDETLKLLGSQSFDPHSTVLVSDGWLPAPKPADANQPAGTVQINPNYKPKRVQLDADVKTPAVLMLADRYNPKWKVEVDGKPAKMLRCNFIMRGVYLEPGKHEIVFRFTNKLNSLYVSLTAIGFALVVSCGLAVTRKRGD